MLRPPRRRPPRELLFEFLRGHDRICCELVDHGAYGVEAQFLTNEEMTIGRTFHPRLDPNRTPRVMAIAWAEAERDVMIQQHAVRGSDARVNVPQQARSNAAE